VAHFLYEQFGGSFLKAGTALTSKDGRLVAGSLRAYALSHSLAAQRAARRRLQRDNRVALPA